MTGGKVLLPKTTKDLAEAVDYVSTELKNQYMIGVKPKKGGKLHKVKVEMTRRDDGGKVSSKDNIVCGAGKITSETEARMSEAKFDSYTKSLEYLFRCGDAKAAEKHEETSNVRLIQNLVAAIGRDDLALVSEMLAEDVRLEIQGTDKLPLIHHAEGREQMLDAIIVNFSSLQNQKPIVESVTAQGDTVTVTMEEEGEVRATGKKYRIKCVQRFVIKEGKLAFLEEQGSPV